MFHAFANNPIKYKDPDGRADIDILSLDQLNDVHRYRSDLETLKNYVSEELNLTLQITNKEHEIEKMKGEKILYVWAYAKQTANDWTTAVNLFSIPLQEAISNMNDPYFAAVAFFSSLDPQAVAEAFADYINSRDDRITGENVQQFCEQKDYEIKKIKKEVKELKNELRDLEAEIKRLKKEMDTGKVEN